MAKMSSFFMDIFLFHIFMGKATPVYLSNAEKLPYIQGC